MRRPNKQTLILLLVIGWVLPLHAKKKPRDESPAPADANPVPNDLVEAGELLATQPAEAERAVDAVLPRLAGRDAALGLAIRGMARYQQGRYRAALTDLDGAVAGPLAITDTLRFYAAESAFHTGAYAEALERYQTLAKKHPHSVWRHRARFRVGDCQLALGRHDDGIRTLTRALDEYPEYPFAAAARYALAHAERARNRPDHAARWLRRLIRAWPNDPQAHVARRDLEALEAQGVEPAAESVQDLYDQGYDLRRRKYYDQALTVFGRLLTDPRADAKLRYQSRYQIGRTLYLAERFEEARATFDALIAEAPSGYWKRLSLRWKGNALERLGKLDEAAAALLASAGNPKRPSGDLLMQLGWLYFNNADYPKARDHFVRASKLGGKYNAETRWLRAWLAYRLGDYKVAEAAFKALGARSNGGPQRYGYWLGRTLAHMGETDAAVATLRGVIGSSPLSYYAYQARARLRELGQPMEREIPQVADPDAVEDEEAAPAPGTACAADDEDRTGCKPAEADTAAASATATGSTDSATGEGLGTDAEETTPAAAPERTREPHPLAQLALGWGGALPELMETWQLQLVGQQRAAMARLRALHDEVHAFRRAGRGARGRWSYVPRPYVDYRADTNAAEWGRKPTEKGEVSSRRRTTFLAQRMPGEMRALLGRAFAELGDEHYVRRYDFPRAKLVGPPEARSQNETWRVRYPRAYRDIVEAESARFGLDPHFIWALMTVESTYNPWAISRASARGLMQVMPHTGGLIADRMAWRNFGPALLFEPEVVVRMASWYFHQLLTKFNGQLPLAIASYNAGPHRVAAWLERKGHLPMDEFIEEIPYTEAREYTKKVLRYLALYRRIYEGETRLQVGQVIDPDFRDNINF